MVDREIYRLHPHTVRGGARPARVRFPPAARRPSPPDADRGGARRKESRALSPVLDGRPDAGGKPGGPALDPPPHGDADRYRRDLQLDSRLPRADPEPAHRL